MRIFLFFLLILLINCADSFGQLKGARRYIKQDSCSSIFFDLDKIYPKSLAILQAKDPHSYLVLHKYDNELILYVPCDEIYRGEIVIQKDSVVLSLGETDSRKILSKNMNKKNDESTYVIKDSYGNRSTLILKLFDPIRKVYMAKIQGTKQTSYFFIVNALNAHNFPIVINECPKGKCEELVFDNVDYIALF